MSHGEKQTFFRQSLWMVVANVLTGVFMMASQVIASGMPTEEYGVFFTLLRFFTLLAIPAAGLQTVLAQQAAEAVTEEAQRDLSTALRRVLSVTFILWTLLLIIVLILRKPILGALKIQNPWALWMMMILVLSALWLPVVQGVIHGRQNFRTLGFSMIGNGFGRFAGVAVMVLVLHCHAAGAMTGTWIGVSVGLAIAAWPARSVITGPKGRHNSWGWVGRVLPLTLGTGSVLFMMNLDMLIVQSHFPKELTAYYAASAMIGLAVMMFTTPVAAVMFPKIAHSRATAQKSNALYLALFGTIGLVGTAALFCTLWPEFPLRLIYFRSPQFLKSAVLIPWFAWAVVPLTIANVMINNLLALGRFSIVPWLVAVAVGYGFALVNYVAYLQPVEPFLAFRNIIIMIGGFGTLLLGIALYFTRAQMKSEP